MIDDFRFGRCVVNGRAYTRDIIIYPDHVDPNWLRKEAHVVCLDDLKGVLTASPEVLIVGIGAYGIVEIADEVVQRLAKLGIELKTARTASACKMYNGICSKKKAVAALHVTC
jgi:hypothetical protein